MKISHESGNAPISVVRYAERVLEKDPDFDQVYTIFDRDNASSYDEAIVRSKKLAAIRAYRKEVISVIPSVPCFEVWYLFHLGPWRKLYAGAKPADGIIRDLETIDPVFAGCTKTDCAAFYDRLTDLRDDALKYSKDGLSAAKEVGDAEFHENPSTRVHRLVKALEKMSDDQKSGRT